MVTNLTDFSSEQSSCHKTTNTVILGSVHILRTYLEDNMYSQQFDSYSSGEGLGKEEEGGREAHSSRRKVPSSEMESGPKHLLREVT